MDDAVPGSWQLDPDTRLGLRLKRLRASLEEGQFEEAILEAEELLDEEPDYPDALYLLGEALLDGGDPEGAVMAFGRHVQLAPEDLESLLRLGLAQYEICDLTGAEEIIREVARRQPDHALAQYQLSLVFEAQGRKTESLSALMLANRLDPESFPLPSHWTAEQWQESLADAMVLLPARLRRFWADVPMHLEPAPTLDELRGEDPPLSPRTTGLFEGDAPRDPESTERPTSMRFFLRNLNKAISYDELVEWVAAALEREACEWLGIDPEELD
ncbi:MAG: tetratricopeptide repeat protein [Deltaproteobacteria bacterium]|nr:MAG: tetratricopeptide repeat protein [Deltaproteobacteria bacterium]